jgi:hypothetical protein
MSEHAVIVHLVLSDDAFGTPDELFAAVEPLLRESKLSSGGHAIKRYGEATDADAKEVRVDF